MKKLLTTAILLGLATVSTGAAAQNTTRYYEDTQSEVVLQQVLSALVGQPYANNRTYRTREQQEMFRRADTNHDGRLSQSEIDSFRAGMRYARNDGRHNDRYDRGIAVSRIDINRDGYISRSEQRDFIRMIDNDRDDRNDWRN